MDAYGNVVATGANNVPRAGGGLYGEGFPIVPENGDEIESGGKKNDHRCAFRDTVFCSNNREQNEIINDLIEKLPPDAINIEKDE